MREFVTCENNTTVVLVTEEDYDRLQGGRGMEHGYFLFYHPDLMQVEPWFHGDHRQMGALIKGCAGQVRSESMGVPFSNGAQLYASAGPQALRDEFDKLATWTALLDVFGPKAWKVYYTVLTRRQLALV